MSRLDWDRDGADWPFREFSQFVTVGPARWHVQRMGTGDRVLLLHGTGASGHSWRGLAGALGEQFELFIPDLPGHGFTQGRPRGGMTLEGVATALADLLEEMDAPPRLVIAHSAGAAIACQMILDDRLDVPIMGFAPALLPFPGLAAQLFPAMAKMLFINPLVPRIFAQMAGMSGETRRFLKRSTGSTIDAAGIALYTRLLSNHRHVGGALSMMANWDLERFSRRLGDVDVPTLWVAGCSDNAVPPGAVARAARAMGDGRLERMQGGHLMHEEFPDEALRLIQSFASSLKVA